MNHKEADKNVDKRNIELCYTYVNHKAWTWMSFFPDMK